MTPNLHPLRVLCVDDLEDSADSLSMLFDLWGHECEVCYGGKAALALTNTFAPDVYLLDLSMPGMDGLELAGLIRARTAGRPVLLIAATALNSESMRGLAALAGFNHYFVKPVEFNDLLAAINAFATTLYRTPPQVPEPAKAAGDEIDTDLVPALR